MDIKYSNEDIKALDEKFNNPHSTVKCPRCGNKLNFQKIGTSSVVRCQTDNCLEAAYRGL